MRKITLPQVMGVTKPPNHELFHQDFERKKTDMQLHLTHCAGLNPNLWKTAWTVIYAMNNGMEHKEVQVGTMILSVSQAVKHMKLECFLK